MDCIFGPMEQKDRLFYATCQVCRIEWYATIPPSMGWHRPCPAKPSSLPQAAVQEPNKCVHRGAELAGIRCPTCKGETVLKTFECGLAEKSGKDICTVGTKIKGYACCRGCPGHSPVLIVPSPLQSH